ncbi:hypothetical protein TELCIR_00062 [Teladorsagia circumcincta]|uniref:Uncharacterized protein n=1 Tax=Teladorsagia circumcincta TaxID=45464 RepID=A0A2G9V7R4_TELCI|nr:hypothetical protein TELCIR_00062 [Teladorsagia circumcincta]
MSPLASSTVVAKAKKKRKRRLLEDTFYHDLDSAENCSVLNRTCLTEGTSPVSSSVLSYKTTKKKKKKVSQKVILMGNIFFLFGRFRIFRESRPKIFSRQTSILSSDNGDRHSSPEQFSSAENCQLSVGSAIDQSIGSVKKKRKLNLEKTSSMDLSYQSAAGISWQRLSTDESCFKTPKKLKRKIGEETDDSFVKRRPHDDADAGSDGKVRKKKKKKKPLCDIPV